MVEGECFELSFTKIWIGFGLELGSGAYMLVMNMIPQYFES